MKRQGMEVTPQELRNLANNLECEFRDTLSNINVKLRDDEIANKKFQVNIINKSKSSDTWKFEQ